MNLAQKVEDARIAKIASPFTQKTPIQQLIDENTFTLEEAAALIPMNSKASLTAWLFRHKRHLPAPRYRNVLGGSHGTIQVRVLTIDEIKHIRNIVMFGREDVRYRGFGVARRDESEVTKVTKVTKVTEQRQRS